MSDEAKKYRKKPIVINALQWDGRMQSVSRLSHWTAGAVHLEDDCTSVVCETLEGPLRVSPGDWIIEGVKGEYYPCKADVFEATYERVAGHE